MRISAKAEYACLAVLELAMRSGQPEPVRASDIAGANQIPQRFLIQILLQLKGAGHVVSVRGAAGGYRLADDPSRISVWDIVQIIDGSSEPAADAEREKASGWRVLRKVWQTVNFREKELLKEIRFDQLVKEALQPQANMYYI